MNARAGTVRPLRAAGRRTAAARRTLRSAAGSITPAVLGIVLALLLVSILLADFVAVLAAHAAGLTAADSAAAAALQAWRAAAGDASETGSAGDGLAPPAACAALSAFDAAQAEIAAAAAHYAAANGASLDPEHPPVLVAGHDGIAIRVTVLRSLRLPQYADRLDPAHQRLRVRSSAAWPAPDWASADLTCPDLLP